VLDALGQRWAVDLGGDDYNLPAYFGNKRWTYYRLRTEGHNTLTFNGENQDPSASASLVAFASAPARAFAIADLSRASKLAARWQRGIALLDRKEVLVQDEVELKEPGDIAWTMHTPATIMLDGATATLKIGESCLRAAILEPKDAKFETAPAAPPPPQAQNQGITRLMVKLPQAKEARLAILLTPYRGQPPAPQRAIAPLKQWVEDAPGSALAK